MSSKVLVSPTEPPTIRVVGTTSAVPERHGVDIMWFGRGLKWGIQRKEFPGDFLSSLHDGRLDLEVGQMSDLTGGGFIVLEGMGMWTDDGELIARKPFTIRQLIGLQLTAASRGIPVLRTRNQVETLQVVPAIIDWTRKEKHSSLSGARPGAKSRWGTPDSREWLVHLITGFPGIGPETAAAIIDHFGGVPFRWAVEGERDEVVKALMGIPGIGKVRATKLARMLGGQ